MNAIAQKPSGISAAPLISLQNVSVEYNGVRVLHHVTWALHKGEHWAVIGPNGSGKSTFLKLLRGEIWPAPMNGGQRVYAFEGDVTESPIGVGKRIATVSAEQQTKYMRADWDLRVWQVLFTGIADTDLIYREPTSAELNRVEEKLNLFDLIHLRNVPFRALSQGQLRKVLVVRALIRDPQILICDEIGVGLDPAMRRDLYALIERAANAGMQVLMVSHRREELIPSINRTLELREGKVHCVDERRETTDHRQLVRSKKQEIKFGHELPIVNHQSSIINITNADVAVDAGRLVVLHNVNWTIREGQHWFVSGPNGAGKTTLMRLLLGELSVNRAGRIVRFDDDSLDNVWDIKKRVGYVSPELQTRYSENLSAFDVIATGFNASVGWLQPINPKQQARVRELLALFRLEPLADRGILNMSYGQARKILIARALANGPRLLLLDEAFDGLDAGFRADIARVLEHIAPQTTIVLVSHYEDDRLALMTHTLRLANGQIQQAEPTTASHAVFSPPQRAGGGA